MASGSKPPAPNMQQIDISKLSILEKLNQESDREINILTDSLQTLKMAQGKFAESGKSVESITPEMNGKTILVPLTSSMYVPGTVTDTTHVIIDVGTGYYAKKDIEAAKDYFKRKVAFVTEQMEKIQGLLIEKSDLRKGIINTMELIQSDIQNLKPSTS